VLLRYPAYRRYSEARIAVNDAMMALLIGSRLGEHALANSAASPSAMLPELFGRIDGIERLNRTVGDAAVLLARAEEHLVYMAIPYALSVHGSFISASAEMLRAAGHDEAASQRSIDRQRDLSHLPLEVAHEYVEERCRLDLDPTLLQLFHLSRRVRNRIIHFSGATGSRLLGEYRQLPKPVREGWERLARRPLTEAVDDGRLALRDGELIAVLATSRHLAQDVSNLLAHTIDRTSWADIAVADYRALYPQRFGERDKRHRRVKGFADRYYRPLRLTAEEIADACTRGK
jgi:hypothetical protein